MSNPNPLPPPISGQWKPGQSGNPEGGRISKRNKEAIAEAHRRLGMNNDPQESRVKAAVALVVRAHNGDVAAYKEIADREDGRIPTTIGGSTDVGPIRLYWPSGDE